MTVLGRPSDDASAHAEQGAAAVETALVLPLVLMLVFGMLWGGILMFRSITISDAAREATRFGATLPVDTSTNDWLNAVVQRVVDSADGELDASHTDRSICVALVGHDGGGKWLDGAVTTGSSEPCFNDNRPADEARVQIRVARDGDLNAVIWQRTVTLQGQAVARYEVGP